MILIVLAYVLAVVLLILAVTFSMEIYYSNLSRNSFNIKLENLENEIE